tara:strand:- start:14 stop:700 length:687 start_codon:yes stop_codon:yes gene_type:complete
MKMPAAVVMLALIALLSVGCGGAGGERVVTPAPILAPVAIVPPAGRPVDLAPVADGVEGVRVSAAAVAAAVAVGGRWSDRLARTLEEREASGQMEPEDVQALQAVARGLETALEAALTECGNQVEEISALVARVREAVAEVAAARAREDLLRDVVTAQNERIQTLTAAAGAIAVERDLAREDAAAAGGQVAELAETRDFWRRRAIVLGIGMVLLVAGGGVAWARGGIF